jgi:YVTN family beta-propeller protein
MCFHGIDEFMEALVALPDRLARPMGLTLSPDEKTLFVSTGRGQSVAFVDVATRRVLREAREVGARPWGLGVTPDGSKLYTANGPGNDVSVIDVATGEVVRRIPVGRSPWGVVVAP